MEVIMSKPLCSSSVVVAAAAFLITASMPAGAQSGWQYRNFPAPNAGWLAFRIVAGGNPECASYNGRDCLWGEAPNQIHFDRVLPLVCGADHRDKWGVTGYEDPKHWCNLARGGTRID
jgi:hypothetical protein